MKTNLEKGFTILEVLVAMAIVGMLIAAAAFGISAVQRNSRDTKRKTYAQQVKIAYEDFYGNYGRRPTTITYSINGNNGQIEVSDGTRSITQQTVIFPTAPVTVGACAAPAQETNRDNASVCVSNAAATLGNIQVNLESTSTGFFINN